MEVGNGRQNPVAAVILTVIIIVLALVASAGGMIATDLYRGNDFVLLAWAVNDAVTLFVGVPLLGLSLLLALLGSMRGRLVWAGMLGFMTYNYGFYLFGAAYNAHFLLYTGLFILPVFALLSLLHRPGLEAIRAGAPPRSAATAVGAYMLLWGVLLGFMWSMQSVDHIRTGKLPELLETTGGDVHLIAAMDLCFVVPWFLLGGWWLLRGNPWGVVVGVISNTKGAVYCMVLAWGAHAGERLGFGGGELLPLWIAVCLLSAASVAVLLWRIRPTPFAVE
jgi:hypothetical protein